MFLPNWDSKHFESAKVAHAPKPSLNVYQCVDHAVDYVKMGICDYLELKKSVYVFLLLNIHQCKSPHFQLKMSIQSTPYVGLFRIYGEFWGYYLC